MPMRRYEWCRSFIYLRGRPINFDGRPYLRAIYNTTARRVVLRCSRQVEKTTFITNAVIHGAITIPGVHIIVVFPRREQALVFANSRLLPVIFDSPAVRKILLGRTDRRPQVFNMRLANNSKIYVRAAFHNPDPVRGIDGDFLFLDEYQDIAHGGLGVLEESLSHSPHRRVVITGTPKDVSNHLEDAFNRSTAQEWRVPCACGEHVFLDENCLGLYSPICPACQLPLDPSRGLWVARNRGSVWGDGFTLNHLATPWLDYPKLLENQQSYNPALFRNECLGLPTYLGDHVVTQDEVEQCCVERRLARSLADVPAALQGRLVAGIDWSGGAVSRTVLVIGYMADNDHFHVLFLERYRAQEDPNEILKGVARRCQEFRVALLAADGAGVGAVYNNLLLSQLPHLSGLYAMFYHDADQRPNPYKGRLWHWTIGRTGSLGMVFTRIKNQRIQFPRLEDCRSFLGEIWCETAEHDDHRRTIRFTHPETQPDDTLHALNYVVVLGRFELDRRRVYL
jgi:hypothetical protein